MRCKEGEPRKTKKHSFLVRWRVTVIHDVLVFWVSSLAPEYKITDNSSLAGKGSRRLTSVAHLQLYLHVTLCLYLIPSQVSILKNIFNLLQVHQFVHKEIVYSNTTLFFVSKSYVNVSQILSDTAKQTSAAVSGHICFVCFIFNYFLWTHAKDKKI